MPEYSRGQSLINLFQVASRSLWNIWLNYNHTPVMGQALLEEMCTDYFSNSSGKFYLTPIVKVKENPSCLLFSVDQRTQAEFAV